LTVMGALATGSDKIYISEEKITLQTLQKDLTQMMHSFKEHPQSSSLILYNEHTSKVFSTQTLAKIFQDQCNGLFEVRTATLGHVQQGGAPYGIDRIYATFMASVAIQFIEEQK